MKIIISIFFYDERTKSIDVQSYMIGGPKVDFIAAEIKCNTSYIYMAGYYKDSKIYYLILYDYDKEKIINEVTMS